MWFWSVNVMIGLVSGMPAPQFGEESPWVWRSELVQGSSGSRVSFLLTYDVFAYTLRCLSVLPRVRVPEVEDHCAIAYFTNKSTSRMFLSILHKWELKPIFQQFCSHQGSSNTDAQNQSFVRKSSIKLKKWYIISYLAEEKGAQQIFWCRSPVIPTQFILPRWLV
jgi:hypothetical protein